MRRERVLPGEGALAADGRDHRCVQLLGERAQRFRTARATDDPAAREDHRARRRGQQVGGRAISSARGADVLGVTASIGA